jgi:predicted transcriptional regulator
MLFVRYRRMGQELAEERKKLGMSQEPLAKTRVLGQNSI